MPHPMTRLRDRFRRYEVDSHSLAPCRVAHGFQGLSRPAYWMKYNYKSMPIALPAEWKPARAELGGSRCGCGHARD
jgi:hypothetical protein